MLAASLKEAHHAAIDLSWYVADTIQELREHSQPTVDAV